MRKIISVLLVQIMLLTLLGCSFQQNNKPPITLTMWHVYGEQENSPFRLLVEQFNSTLGKEKGIVIKITNITATPDLINALLTAKEDAPGTPDMPDLFSAQADTVLNLGAENLVDFTDFFSQEELQQYRPEFLASGMINGRLSVFPVAQSTRVLYLNDLLFSRFSEETGVGYDQLRTWDGFFAAAARYYQWSGGKPFCAFDYLIENVELDMLASGHKPIYNTAGWYDTSDPHLYDSWMRFAAPLAQGHIIVSDKFANTQVMTGEVAAGIGSSAAVNYYNDVVIYPDNTSEELRLKILPLPRTGTGAQYMPITGTGFASWHTTAEKAEAAAVFLRWFTEVGRNLSFGIDAGYLSARTEAYDAMDTAHYPSAAHAALFEAVHTMQTNYIPTTLSSFTEYSVHVEQLYPGLKALCPDLRARADSGVDPGVLAEETWDLFLRIGKDGEK